MVFCGKGCRGELQTVGELVHRAVTNKMCDARAHRIGAHSEAGAEVSRHMDVRRFAIQEPPELSGITPGGTLPQHHRLPQAGVPRLAWLHAPELPIQLLPQLLQSQPSTSGRPSAFSDFK